ncbi:MAG TPA: DUF177 domain-containing protein [Chloroflexota bacterium]|nr:DUF177 domain-containing protein [Chloroflexota bacterium]
MTLEFNLSQLMKGAVGETRSYEISSDEPIDLDDATASDIHGAAKFTLTNFGVVAAVHADAQLDLVCARCLETFRGPTAVDFEEEYQPVIDIATGLPSKTPRNENAFSISPRHTIDLREALRQHLTLAVDLIPVCRPDCKGLCPTCGVNLNNETCACEPVEETGPFAALKTLLKDVELETKEETS